MRQGARPEHSGPIVRELRDPGGGQGTSVGLWEGAWGKQGCPHALHKPSLGTTWLLSSLQQSRSPSIANSLRNPVSQEYKRQREEGREGEIEREGARIKVAVKILKRTRLA